MFFIPHNPPAIIAPANTNQICFTKDLQNCEPKSVWAAFEDISKIYRESGHCAQISTYIESRLKKDGFTVEKKPDGTICATRGLNKEKNNAIILQSHIDIVSVSADGNTQKPINFVLKDNFLYADNRTLGADNGLGAAAMLAVAEDEKFINTSLELIFTTDEETGMYGAKSLKAQDFYGKYLINLDSEKYCEIVNGCAGIVKFQIKKPLQMDQLKDSKNFKEITIAISGARGGHSAEIQAHSLNPILVLLKEVGNIKDLMLVSFTGGERENSIPRNAQAVFLVPADRADKVTAKLKSDFKKLSSEEKKNNPDFSYLIMQNEPAKEISFIDTKTQEKFLKNLNKIPLGLLRWQENGKKTSQNLGVLKISDGEFYMEIMGRSSYKSDFEKLKAKTSDALSQLCGKEITATETSSIWNSNSNSKLETIALKSYVEVPDCKKPEIKAEHGGLEPAIFIETKPDLDIISIGPTIEEPHSVQERVKTDTVEPFYTWLCKIIEEIADKN